MAETWELNVKSSFLTDLLALPNKKVARQVQEKVEELQRDPRPDGHVRKKLKSHKDPVYRLRVGDYRLLYTFGPGWIRLLGLRLHHDGYDDESIGYEKPVAVPAAVAEMGRGRVPTSPGWLMKPASDLSPPSTATLRPLPRILTSDLLTQAQVPVEHHAVLRACTDEDSLLAADVPSDVWMRVVEALYPRPVEELLQQPDLVLSKSEDLVRFAEGCMDLKDFLLRLDPEQERAVDWGTKGPLLIKGGPGVGKSITLLYRVRSLLTKARQDGKLSPCILLTTYTNALCRFSQQLLGRLLEPQDLRRVTVWTADKLARNIAHQHGKLEGQIAEERELRAVLKEVRERVAAASKTPEVRVPARLRDDYLLDEFAWVIEGRGITRPGQYSEADRSGRGVRLTEKDRKAIWNLYAAFREELKARQLLSWGQVRGRAWTLAKEGKYKRRFDAVLVDEAQDLTPLSLGLLVELSGSPEGVCLTADANQTLYSRGFTWQHVHQGLKFTGRSVILKRNYRTTREITAAAASFLSAGGGEDTESLGQNCTLTGPKPVLQPYRDMQEMALLVAAYLRSCLVRQRLQFQTAAVLTATVQAGKNLAQALSQAGVQARYMASSELDLDAEVVKVMTLHSAKGLEFPTVVVAGLEAGILPRVLRYAEPEEQQEQQQQARRLVFVGMTRAMHNLLVLHPEKRPSPFVTDLDAAWWDRQECPKQASPCNLSGMGGTAT